MSLIDGPTENTMLETALTYAARGWRVIPIPPGLRFPRGFPEWQNEGTTDTAQIQAWWTQYPNYGIGVLTGSQSNLWVLDVDVKDGQVGRESLAALEEQYGPLPPTYEVVTGSGGSHFYFTWPTDGQIITNDQSGKLGQGIDVRGVNGFVVAPPSTHEYGTTYEVEVSAPDEVAEAPAWLLQLLLEAQKPRQSPSVPTGSEPASDRPGDRYAAQTTWAELLVPDGWTFSHLGMDGEEHWTRPGKKVSQGTSATTNYAGKDSLKVFTSSLLPHLEPGKTYTKMGYLAATRFSNSENPHSEAARYVKEALDGPAVGSLTSLLAPGMPRLAPQEAPQGQWGTWEPLRQAQGQLEASPVVLVDGWPSSALPSDLADAWDGTYEPVYPTRLLYKLPDESMRGFFYDASTNGLFGDSNAGKTWIALLVCMEAMLNGDKTLYLDWEGNGSRLVNRLKLLGVPKEVGQSLFTHIRPSKLTMPEAEALATHDFKVCIIDASTGALAQSGLKPNEADDVERWFSQVADVLALAGACVVILDHPVKNKDGSNSLYPSGSHRKRDALSGAGYLLEGVEPFTRHKNGQLKFTCTKDREGELAYGAVVAYADVTHPATDSLHFRLYGVTPTNIEEEKDKQAERSYGINKQRLKMVYDYVKSHEGANPLEGVSKKGIRDSVPGSPNLLIKDIEYLLNGGFLQDVGTPSRSKLRSTDKPYVSSSDDGSAIVRSSLSSLLGPGLEQG